MECFEADLGKSFRALGHAHPVGYGTRKPLDIRRQRSIELTVVGGVLTCGLWCYGMIWLDRKNLPGPLQMGRPQLLATVLSRLLLSAMGFKALYDYFAALYEQYGLHLFE